MFPSLQRDALTKIATGIKVPEGALPLTSLFGGLVQDVEGDVARWDERQPVTTLDSTFQSRDSEAANSAPGTYIPKSSQMLTSFQKREIKPEHMRMLRTPGSEAAASAAVKTGLMLGDMERRFYWEKWELLIAGALKDDLSVTVNGVTVTPDFGLDASHDTTAAASWATPTTDIDADVEAIRRIVMEDSGYAIRTALCGRNVFGRVRKNTAVKEWFTAREGAPSSFAGFQGKSISGLFGLNWLTIESGHGVGSGSWTPFIGDDEIIFIPEISNDWFQLHRGSVMAPRVSMSGNPDPFQFDETYGVARWCEFRSEPPSAWYFMRWAGLAMPVFPAAYFVFDTTT